MFLRTNRNLSSTLLLLVGVLLGYTSCTSRNPETSSQGSPTPKKPDKAGNIPIEEALPDALIDRVEEPELQERLRELKKNPATIDEVVSRGGHKIQQWTVLQLAALWNELEVVQGLLQAGADPNTKDSRWGLTALHVAVKCGHLEVVKALIAAEANINQSGNDGETPLRSAAIHGKVEVVQALLEAGAEPNAKGDCWGLTALHEAVRRGYLEVVKALIAKGANINQPDNDGETPLQLAAICNEPEILQALLQ